MENLRLTSLFFDNYYLFKYKEYLTYVKKHIEKVIQHKSYTTAVAMAAVTFQYGGYFGNKVIKVIS